MNSLIKCIVLLCFVFSCKQPAKSNVLAENNRSFTENKIESKQLPQDFKDYWYAGKAEISSYRLEQARYGEIRKGSVVLIFVTEDFLPKIQVKADHPNPETISILKLNAVKKFNTGIYPYSIMQSVFYPVSNNQHALKVSSSIQEWCGHVYAQLNNRNKFEIISHSYFGNEADKTFKLNKAILENELWAQLRINPKSLPTGNVEIIPSFEYTRMHHVAVKAYKAITQLTANSYAINYPELQRNITINFNPKFPYEILSWEETYKSGFGDNAKILTTKATKLKTIKSAYWNKNSNKYERLRDTLKLK